MNMVQLWLRVERQESIEDSECSVLQAEAFPRLTYVTKHFPLLYACAWARYSGGQLPFNTGKGRRPPPNRRRYMSRLHFFSHLSLGNRNSLTQSVPPPLTAIPETAFLYRTHIIQGTKGSI